MALVFPNRAWMTTATTGTGTITLGVAQSSYLTFAEAGVANADTANYTILDGANFESGVGTYTSAGTTFSRDTVTVSKIAGVAGTSKISLSGTATIFLTQLSAEIVKGEEGTWTPTLTFETPGNVNVVYSTRVGIYNKIRKLVYLEFVVVTSTFTHTTAAGNLTVTGLPFTSQNTAGAENDGALSWSGITKANYTQIHSLLQANTSAFLFRASGSGQNSAAIAFGDTPTGGTMQLYQTITYAATA